MLTLKVLLMPMFITASSAAPPSAVAAADTLDAVARREIVERIILVLDAQYVFPAKVREIAAHLRERIGSGAYDALTDAISFARTLTQELQSITRDIHLRVRAPELPPARTNTRRDAVPPDIGRAELMRDSIGYLEIRGFPMVTAATREAVRQAMNRVADARALIIDLRNNGGGTAEMVAHIASYLFGNRRVQMSSVYWRTLDDTVHFYTDARVPGRKFGATKPVYVLTSMRTFSAAEAFVYDLQARKRVIVVGERTGGGAHPGGSHALPRGLRVFVPAGRAINPVTGTNWEGTGVTPDITVPADSALPAALRDLQSRR